MWHTFAEGHDEARHIIRRFKTVAEMPIAKIGKTIERRKESFYIVGRRDTKFADRVLEEKPSCLLVFASCWFWLLLIASGCLGAPS